MRTLLSILYRQQYIGMLGVLYPHYSTIPSFHHSTVISALSLDPQTESRSSLYFDQEQRFLNVLGVLPNDIQQNICHDLNIL